MDERAVRSASPVNGLAGLTGRSPRQLPQRQSATVPPRPAPPQEDGVAVGPAFAVALRLLRERVLSRTRESLGIGEATVVPVFAEIVEDEPIPTFLGRLLSAQNQLVAWQVGQRTPRVRDVLAAALAQGAAETIELLAGNADHGVSGAAVVSQVLAEFDRRLAAQGSAIADESDEGPD